MRAMKMLLWIFLSRSIHHLRVYAMQRQKQKSLYSSYQRTPYVWRLRIQLATREIYGYVRKAIWLPENEKWPRDKHGDSWREGRVVGGRAKQSSTTLAVVLKQNGFLVLMYAIFEQIVNSRHRSQQAQRVHEQCTHYTYVSFQCKHTRTAMNEISWKKSVSLPTAM